VLNMMAATDIQIATLIVAAAAVVGSIAAPVWVARHSSKEWRKRWKHELQLPAYRAFVDSVDGFIGLAGGRAVSAVNDWQTHLDWQGRGTAAFSTSSMPTRGSRASALLRSLPRPLTS
jgi:hypothetical protein